MSAFVFVADPATLSDEQTLLLHVPSGIADKSELLAWFGTNLRLPTYFGSNWDAFEECLRDLSWIEQKKLIIAHRDVPLTGNHHDQQTYLKLLVDVVSDWESNPTRSLIVSFDPVCEQGVSSAISGTR